MIMICVALWGTSLACLQAAATAETPGAVAPLAFGTQAEDSAGAVYEIPPTIETRTRQSCAVVAAEVALHLREDASAGAAVLGWLDHGERVRVIDQSRGDWWLVQAHGLTGYARAMYLVDGGCG